MKEAAPARGRTAGPQRQARLPHDCPQRGRKGDHVMRVATKGWTLLALLVAVVVFFFAAGATSTRVTGVNLKMWSGIVSTTGSSNITATFSGSVGSIETGLAAQEFSASPGPSKVWVKDASGGISNLSSTTVTLPRLMPASTGELYFGY